MKHACSVKMWNAWNVAYIQLTGHYFSFWIVWIKRGYGGLYYTLPVNYVNTDPITFKMLLLRHGASGSWVVQLQILDSFVFANHP